ncbi:DUF4430 domain-containing protein [Bacillus kwashiorkori]|uniref:DUF4430 domain-containing protein n=1 Tax=Bacillus kwashiorkori TaxID=1522318 RepID=UPI000782B71B|nr:DUF4430 domain-containing protein [Bacillus kwashiorkori]
MFQKQRWQSIFITFTVILLLFAQSSVLSLSTANAAILENGATVTVLNEKGEPVIQTTAVPFEIGATAADVLEKIANVTYEESDFGAFMTGINGIFPEGESYWGFFINGIEANEGAPTYKIENGDNILFKMTHWPPVMVDATVVIKDKLGAEIIPKTEVTIVKGATAYDALVQATLEHNLSISASVDDTWLTFLNNIGDILGNNEYFGAYLNGSYMEVGLVSYLLTDGDQLELKVESYQTSPEEPSEPGDKDPIGAPEQPDQPDKGHEQIDIQKAIDSAIQYISNKDNFDFFTAIAFNGLSLPIPNTYLQKTIQDIVDKEAKFRNVTDLEKAILIVTAAGKDANNIAGYNLIEQLTNHERLLNQGSNGVIFALLALDSANYQTLENSTWNRDQLVNSLLEHQLSNGAWALAGDNGSADITGMALAALAPYQNEANVKTAIRNAVQWLSNFQSDSAGFYEAFNGGEAIETVSQVIIGLTALNIDPTGKLFTKGETNLIDFLLAAQQTDGGFAHLPTDNQSSSIATSQALMALAAYEKFAEGTGSIYSLVQKSKDLEQVSPVEDTKNSDTTNPKEENAQEGKPLPNTATAYYNLLLIGLSLLLFSATAFYYHRKKITTN